MNWQKLINELPTEKETRAQQIDATFRWALSEYTRTYYESITAWIKAGDITAAEAIALYAKWAKMVEGIE